MDVATGRQYCGPMGDRPLQLAELLEFRPDEGIIRLHEQRVVILSAAAMGLLRKELIDTLGPETTRRLLMRFGFADGYHDAVSLRDRAAWSNPVDGSAGRRRRAHARGHRAIRDDVHRLRRGERAFRRRGRVARFL